MPRKARFSAQPVMLVQMLNDVAIDSLTPALDQLTALCGCLGTELCLPEPKELGLYRKERGGVGCHRTPHTAACVVVANSSVAEVASRSPLLLRLADREPTLAAHADHRPSRFDFPKQQICHFVGFLLKHPIVLNIALEDLL